MNFYGAGIKLYNKNNIRWGYKTVENIAGLKKVLVWN